MNTRRPLTLRNDPATAGAEPLATRDLLTRGVTLRAASIDEQARSVEVVMSTEAPVTVYDWERGIIDEVLVADGGQYPAQVPLLEAHGRHSLDCVLGSVRDIRRDGATWVGRAVFAEGDGPAERAWNKVRQGHLTDVSIGYRSVEYVDIPAGQTATVAGRSFTAGGRRSLRVTTRYEAAECSVVPIGADRKSKVRGEGDPAPHTQRRPGDSGKGSEMNPQLRKYLESLGLRSDATDDQAKAFLSALGGEQKVRADAIAANTMTLEEALRQSQRNEPPANGGGTSTATIRGIEGQQLLPGLNAADTATLRAEAARAERERMLEIRKLAGPDVDPALVERAEAEGWTVERASREILKDLRERRDPSVGADNGQGGGTGGATAPGGIVRDRERTLSRGVMGLALAMRAGVTDDKAIQATVRRLRIGGEGATAPKWEDLAQRADQFRDMSLLDVCREAIRFDNAQVPHGRQDTIRAAVSGGSLTNIFTTSMNARLMMAWDEETDTTTLWVAETEAPNFKQNDDIDVTANARLERHGRGGTAKHASISDTKESWKLARYSKQFVVDEMDIIDDNFSKLQDMPAEFGRAARRLRPDLVYALLLANPTLAGDAVALFHATHTNLTTGAGSALQGSALKTAVKQMAAQKLGAGKEVQRLNIRPAFLIVPPDLEWTGRELISSAEIRDTTANTVRGTRNVVQDLGLTLISEGRIDETGVLDPTTDAVRTGTATNWFLASRPGRTVKVGYLRGSGRGPMTRTFVLDKGQYGIGCDVKMDIAAAVDDFRGLHKSAGA